LARLSRALASRGHDADTIFAEGLRGCDDLNVWSAIQAAARLLVTRDLRFSDVRSFPPGTHHGVLLVRLRDPGRESLYECVLQVSSTSDVETWKGCLVVLTERKLRIRKPPPRAAGRP
jgi:predicted nuclease of predicted toxin-antitoxin system